MEIKIFNVGPFAGLGEFPANSGTPRSSQGVWQHEICDYLIL